jgi:hypothetical protein
VAMPDIKINSTKMYQSEDYPWEFLRHLKDIGITKRRDSDADVNWHEVNTPKVNRLDDQRHALVSHTKLESSGYVMLGVSRIHICKHMAMWPLSRLSRARVHRPDACHPGGLSLKLTAEQIAMCAT